MRRVPSFYSSTRQSLGWLAAGWLLAQAETNQLGTLGEGENAEHVGGRTWPWLCTSKAQAKVLSFSMMYSRTLSKLMLPLNCCGYEHNHSGETLSPSKLHRLVIKYVIWSTPPMTNCLVLLPLVKQGVAFEAKLSDDSEIDLWTLSVLRLKTWEVFMSSPSTLTS